MPDFRVQKFDSYWVAVNPYGKWYGLDMRLDRKAAEEIVHAMIHAYGMGLDAKQREIRKVLGIREERYE